MKKLTLLLIFILAVGLLSAETKKLTVFLEDIELQHNDTLWKPTFSAATEINFYIQLDIPLYTEDVKLYIDEVFQEFGEFAQLVRINPTRVAKQYTYGIRFKNHNFSTLALHISNYKYDFKTNVVLQLKEPKDLIVDIEWKHPIQANRADKTGISTTLETYFVSLDIETSEPIKLKDLAILLNGEYYDLKKTKHELKKCKGFYSKGVSFLYRYEFVQEIPLQEGYNEVRLEVQHKNIRPLRPKTYSSKLYIQKE